MGYMLQEAQHKKLSPIATKILTVARAERNQITDQIVAPSPIKIIIMY